MPAAGYGAAEFFRRPSRRLCTDRRLRTDAMRLPAGTPKRGPRRKPLPSALRRRRRAGSSVLFREIPLLCAAVRRNLFRRTCFYAFAALRRSGKAAPACYVSVRRPAPDRCSYPACGAGLRRPHIVSLQSLCSVLRIWREYSASAAFVNPHAMRASKRRLIGIFTKLLPKYMCKMRIVI